MDNWVSHPTSTYVWILCGAIVYAGCNGTADETSGTPDDPASNGKTHSRVPELPNKEDKPTERARKGRRRRSARPGTSPRHQSSNERTKSPRLKPKIYRGRTESPRPQSPRRKKGRSKSAHRILPRCRNIPPLDIPTTNDLRASRDATHPTPGVTQASSFVEGGGEVELEESKTNLPSPRKLSEADSKLLHLVAASNAQDLQKYLTENNNVSKATLNGALVAAVGNRILVGGASSEEDVYRTESMKFIMPPDDGPTSQSSIAAIEVPVHDNIEAVQAANLAIIKHLCQAGASPDTVAHQTNIQCMNEQSLRQIAKNTQDNALLEVLNTTCTSVSQPKQTATPFSS